MLKSSYPVVLGMLLVGVVCHSATTCGQDLKQIADPDFDAKVAHPAFTNKRPGLLFDEAHHNRHTTRGRFKPFADLMASDGYQVTPNKKTFAKDSLAGFDVLVIANAAAQEEPSTQPAFSEDECDAVCEWVRRGGALLLIADHAPHGSAAKNLANRFGVDMRDGYTKDPKHCFRRNTWQLIFSQENKLLADHSITRGRNKQEAIGRVMTFGGQSLRGPKGSTALLKLADTAVDRPSFRSKDKVSAAGRAQAVALQFGKGRVVVLGEAAMVSAQVLWVRGAAAQSPMGMNVEGIDNRQLALNIMHWLSRLFD